RQGSHDLCYFSHRRPTPDVCHQLPRRIVFAAKLNREIASLADDRVRGVKRAGGINEKSGAANFAVLIDAVNLDDGFGRALEDFFDVLADRDGGLLLREKHTPG